MRKTRKVEKGEDIDQYVGIKVGRKTEKDSSTKSMRKAGKRDRDEVQKQ